MSAMKSAPRPRPPAAAAARVLVVDDDRDTRQALAELLEGFGYVVRSAHDGQAALEVVEADAAEPPDLIISDVCMPRSDGFRMVARLRQAASSRYIPVILISGRHELSRRVAGLDLGADDYLAKPVDADELLARVRVQLRRVRRYDELLRRTIVDELTGVLNRRGIVEALERERSRADRLDHPLTVVMIDVNGFKAINDTFGHSVGDAVLAHIGRSLSRDLRAADQTGRFGGDEFVVVLPDTDEASAAILAQRLRTPQRVPVDLPTAEVLTVTLAVGTATTRGDADDDGVDALLRRADDAMYEDKRRRGPANDDSRAVRSSMR
jgi:two-component system, cell cycle response regulator